MKNIQIAIDYFVTQAALAKAMGVNPMAVTQWKKRGLPIKRALQISELTKGVIKPGDLLPELSNLMPVNSEMQIPIKPIDRRTLPDRRDKDRRSGDGIYLGRRSHDRRNNPEGI